MPNRMRVAIAALLIAAVSALAAVPAAALRSIQLSNPGAIRASTARLTIRQPAGIVITCEVTFEGNLNERIAKSAGAAFGTITAAATRNCVGNEFVLGPPSLVFLTPIAITYNMFLGTLPTITGILVRFDAMAFRIIEARRPVEVRCLYRGPVGALFPVGRGTTEQFTFLAEEIRLFEGNPIEECEMNSRLVGTLRFERARTVTLV